jgi:hypothetical protein
MSNAPWAAFLLTQQWATPHEQHCCSTTMSNAPWTAFLLNNNEQRPVSSILAYTTMSNAPWTAFLLNNNEHRPVNSILAQQQWASPQEQHSCSTKMSIAPWTAFLQLTQQSVHFHCRNFRQSKQFPRPCERTRTLNNDHTDTFLS